MIHLCFQPKVQIYLSVYFVPSLHFSYLILLGSYIGCLKKCMKFCGHCMSGFCNILQFLKEPMVVRLTDQGVCTHSRRSMKLQIR